MLRKLSQTLILALILAVLSPLALASSPGEPTLYPETSSYSEIHNSIEAARTVARDRGKLLMVVMGADWCHDSRGFIDLLADPGFRALVDERYVVQRVNVGYYDFVRDVIQAWDVPVIYGTPTVLVIEPASDTVLNRNTLPYWRNAASMSASDAIDYFDAYTPGPPPPAPATSPELAAALADIDAFEREQAERIYAAYADIGAMMRDLDGERPGPGFREKWDSLAAMRAQITVDLAELRRQAHQQASSGADPIELDFPEYSLYLD
ncbi:thioredoxin family protein [Marinihelvus fidelis]|uniref:Thioredoxin family protein n=1 Tax=Marinihelvus fidelis TaxID=2613842 RepID=A0A5N0THY1_9GAMM|nr:thioredoxin family protein [Marinihelvus fidelis]KAA9134211.1 thioredoxin family protein [Marinihelvus fidelis]